MLKRLVIDGASRGHLLALGAHIGERLRELQHAGAAVFAIGAVTPHAASAEITRNFALDGRRAVGARL